MEHGAHLFFPSQDYEYISSLAQERRPFIPSSPPLDSEVCIHDFNRAYDAELAAGFHPSEDLDLPAKDPFLEYINGVLMEDGMDDDGAHMQHDAQASYRAIMSSFYGVLDGSSPPYSAIGEYMSPNPASDSESSDGMPDFHLLDNFCPALHSTSSHTACEIGIDHQIGPYDKIYPSELHVDIAEQPHFALSSSTRPTDDIGLTTKVNRESHNSLKPETTEVLDRDHDGAHNFVFGAAAIAYPSCLKTAQLNAHSIMAEQCGDFPTNARWQHELDRSRSDKSYEQGRAEFRDEAVQISLSRASVLAFQSPLLGADVNVHRVTDAQSECSPVKAMIARGEHVDTLAEDTNSMINVLSLDVSLEELKLKAGYTDLYVGGPSPSRSTPKSIGSNAYKKRSSSGEFQAGNTSNKKGSADALTFVDMGDALVICAQAVAIGDVNKASYILHELYKVHGASPHGNALQRMTHYFSEALVARLGAVGENSLRAIYDTGPSALWYLKAMKVGYEVSPILKAMHCFANQNILKAAEGASRLHIVEYGDLYGMQWPCLINALADRKGGPPLLVITCIEYPKSSHNAEETGRRLAAYARTYNVPFQYQAYVVEKWEDVDSASLPLHENEVLVVNCMKRLHHLEDESVSLGSIISPRQKLLTSIRSLNPHLLLTAHVHASLSSPFFVSRFREAFHYYSSIFDMLETVWFDNPERLFLERNIYARSILNVVASEGAERVERPETYKQWELRLKRAGFKQLRSSPVVFSRLKAHIKQQYHKDFLVYDDGSGWMLLGWKGRTIIGTSAWRPIPV